MTQTSTLTQNDLLRYLYQETSSVEDKKIETTLSESKDALEYYLDCLDLKLGLNDVKLEPKLTTVEKILRYSRNYQPAI